MSKTVIKNAKIILSDQVIEGSIVIENDKIIAIDDGDCHVSSAIDWEGDYLLPGLIELHTDNMEKYFIPRPGVKWPKVPAILTHDNQMSSAGITTVFDAVAVGYDIYNSDRSQMLSDIIESISYISDQQLSKSDHFIHLRCELSCDSTSNEFDQYSNHPKLKLVSLMDHAPGQRQFANIDKYIEYYQKKYGYSDEKMQASIESHKVSSETWSAVHRRYIAEFCLEKEIPMASHDDATKEHVEEALSYEVNIAEFPTTEIAAKLAHENNLKVLMGAPNLMRGHSHSGNVSARQLAQTGHLDIISSDYYPSSMLHSAFLLSDLGAGYSLSKAINCVTKNPAQSAGLEDRGEITIGKLADVLRVTKHLDMPVLKETWKSGHRVC